MNKIRNKSTKATIVALVLFIIIFLACSFIKQKEDHLLKKINITYNFPLLKKDGDLINMIDSLSIIYSGNVIVYEIPYYFYVEKNDSIVSTKTKFRYFAYQKGADEGSWFDSINALSKKKEKILIVHKEKTFLMPPDLYDKSDDVLIKSDRNKEGYCLIETYTNKVLKDITYSDTMKVYYKNELKNIDYSISKKLDSIKNLKVFKIRLMYNSKFVKGYSYKFPKRELNISIKEDTITNLSKYDDFINAFRKNN